ncbi:MAG TPA: WD40 repeat domain-containing protein, partial [Nitrospira sp.]|nr:WD40 repeat domain-containing protein [Nitrospira sp.]
MSNQTTAPSTMPSAAPTNPQGGPSATPAIDHLEYWKTGFRELKTFRGHSHGVWTVAYAPDGQTIVSGGVDRYVRVW